MKLLFATISAKRSTFSAPVELLLKTYLQRCQRFTPTEHRRFGTEEELLKHVETSSGRTRPGLVLADSTGKLLRSEEFAQALDSHRGAGTQMVVVAIGPADGWTAAARKRADLTISFGRMTLPHELAAVVAVEQIYRALTILANHPYHHGH